MGKKFRIRAVADTVDEANEYMERHSDAALIACIGKLCMIANQYSGMGYGNEYEVTEDGLRERTVAA